MLARLYASVVSLPETEPTDREYPRPPHEAWAELYRDLKGLLGRWDAVREVFDPYDDITDPPVVGSLADALASVYVTCSYVLALTGDAPANDVAWELASSFEIDDGHHAIDAMRAIAAQRKRRA